jgi:hypothetical protein
MNIYNTVARREFGQQWEERRARRARLGRTLGIGAHFGRADSGIRPRFGRKMFWYLNDIAAF